MWCRPNQTLWSLFSFQIVNRIRRQSSSASCELCSHRRRDATKQFRHVGVGGVYWALTARRQSRIQCLANISRRVGYDRPILFFCSTVKKAPRYALITDDCYSKWWINRPIGPICVDCLTIDIRALTSWSLSVNYFVDLSSVSHQWWKVKR